MARYIEQCDEHVKGHRFHLYMRDVAKRMDARQDNMTSQQRADIELAHWQALRVRA
jgi:hypothetical protein